MKKARELHEELKGLAPTLHRLKESGLTPPPPGYFEGLPDEVLRRIRAEEASGLWRREAPATTRPEATPWYGRLAGWLWRPALAMTMVAVLAVALLQLWRNDGPAASAPLAELSAEELHTYVEGRLDEFGEELLLEVTPEEELSLTLPLDDEALDEMGEELLDELSVDELEQLL